MSYQPKKMEIREDFFVIYPPNELEAAKQAEKNGYDVLIEHVNDESGIVYLDSIHLYEHKQKKL